MVLVIASRWSGIKKIIKLVNEAGEPVDMPEGLRLALRFSTDHEETARLREHKRHD